MIASSPAHPHQSAVDLYFGGDRDLFDVYLTACRHQFIADLQEGSQACSASDWARLRRTAHNLKSVLMTLGHPDLSAYAEHQLARPEPWPVKGL
jgi:HPt (histidine-containing phosphotransfer) domain-containing protein